ncbi:ABC transporter substrate-binding protein [Paenibacillus cymbidii]|uniref:ABC transporter substrate-binding protein n=1 Tax=Paenibacillus cymbidii TaxID=1639034 RepID=UPI0010815FB4|nr:ABC transporter substrate-binding protein [Paenibacillus cymbidii]
MLRKKWSRLLTGCAFVLVAAGLVGCGSEQSDSNGAVGTKSPGATVQSPAAASASPAAKAADQTRTIKDEKGEAIIPATPGKIAFVNDNAFEDNMLAMGIKPFVASTFAWSEKKFYPHIADRLQGVNGIDGQAPNLEQLLTWEPDLIIINGQNEKFYEQLNKIAPTVYVGFNADWRVTHLKLAEIVGKTKEAEQNLRDYDAKAAAVKAELHKAIGLEPVMAVVINEKTIRVQGMAGHPLNDLLYKDLGLTPAKGIPSENRMEVSLEGMSTFNPEHIFVQRNRFGTVEQVVNNIQDSSVWKSIPAVKKGHVYNVDNWLAMSLGPIGRGMILDQIRQDMTAAK